MDRQLAEEIIACLPSERTVYHYYRDRYSIGLLKHLSQSVTQKSAITSLKNSDYASLLQKPRIKKILSGIGNRFHDESYWHEHDYDDEQEAFVLTLGLWGDQKKNRWQQTSRNGVNLVLQMNFSSQHDKEYAKLNSDDLPFVFSGHPVSKKRHTMAWARIDLDFESNCALIEEIQNDWLREVLWLENDMAKDLKTGKYSLDEETKSYGANCSFKTAQSYCRFVKERYLPIWDEAMLWAAISFIREEIGINQIFYHSMESGKILKNIHYSLPPRSIYTHLPKRFCFTPTKEVPLFLEKEKNVQKLIKKHKNLHFFKLPELQAA